MIGGRAGLMKKFTSQQNWTADVHFSNRPVGASAFRLFHDYGADVAHGLVLLLGLGTRALPSWDSKMSWNNLYRGLLCPEQLLVIGERTAHPLTDFVRIFALSARTSAKRASMRWSIGFPQR
jgi:hypothetical protein